MLLIGIGSLTGLILGLTGAGGALIAIPLFLRFLGASLSEATFLSLIVVMMASGLNYWSGKKVSDKKIVWGMFAASFIGTYAASLIKPYTNDLIVALLLAGISIYGLWSVWRKKPETKEGKRQGHILIILFSGIIFGALTTLTGLGGGVLIVPLLITVFHFSYEEALPSSLLLIFLISLSSFIMQSVLKGEGGIPLEHFLSLLAGVAIATGLVKFMVKKMPQKKQEVQRQVVFTLVVLYSLVTIGERILS